MFVLLQVTLEEQMICGALQTLNEEAFEDVVGSERPSPTGGQQGEQPQLQLAPIRESAEYSSFVDGYDSDVGSGSSPNGFLLQDHMKQNHNFSIHDNPLPTVIVMPPFVDDTRL